MVTMEDNDIVVSTAGTENVESGFIDEDFGLVDKSTVVTDIPNAVEPEAVPAGVPNDGLCEPMDAGLVADDVVDFDEEDTMFISETLISLPTMIWDKLPMREPEQVQKFNKAFCRYCIKKNIDPFDYLFDEFELGMIAISIAAGYRRDYMELYKKDEEKKVEEKQNAEYNHYADVATQFTDDKPEGAE